MAEYVGTMLKPLGNWVLPKVEERFSYVFSNKKHVEELGKEVKTLEIKKVEIGARVEGAKRQGEIIIPRVDAWQREAYEIITYSQKFLDDLRNSEATCFCYNVVHLYKSGKKAASLHKKVTDKHEEATKFTVVANPPPAAPIVVSSAATSGQEFISRKNKLDEVISALQDEAINVVGIHGMGGVGKTTLVDKLILQARERKLFNVVVQAVVSKTIDIRDIQNQIADKIQYKFQAESIQGRRDELCRILSQKTQDDGKILVILDDVWEAIDFTTQIGIPRMKCCKVVITSRIIHILRGEAIDAHRLFEVGVLEDEEAKVLFAKSLGDYYSTIANDSQYTTVMEGLLKRCGGLPLALVTLAGALKGKDHHIWEDALDKLSKHFGKKIEGMSEKVWSTIMFSFDSLQNEEAKKVLLLCSLFPEDAEIPVQKLVSYGFGIDLFEDSCELDEAMRQVHGFVDKLISCSLLLSVEPQNGSDSYCVRVHDVIRDVAQEIASQDHYNFFTGTSLPRKKNLHAISLSIKNSENIERHLLDVSELRVLGLQCEQKVSSIDFFKGMEKLKVLDLIVKDVVRFSILDPLIGLEHLFLGDHLTKELTTTFEEFKKLKVLDLSGCRSSMKIPTNFISDLSQLQGILLNEGQVINLDELRGCPHLRILHAGLKVATGQQIPCEVVSNLKHLTSFKLVISRHVEESAFSDPFECLTDKLFPKTLVVEDIHGLILISMADILQTGLHSLRCSKIEGLTHIKIVESSILRELKVHDCDEIRCLFGANVGPSNLEYLSLSNLPLLEGICEPKEPPKIMLNVDINPTLCATKNPLFPTQELMPASGTSFSKLRVLKIIKLPRVTSVFPSLSLYTQTLTSLRHLHIEDCESIEEVIASTEEGDDMDAPYPIILSLEELHLKNLPILLHFYRGKHTLNFPLLQSVDIDKCDSLMSPADMWTKDPPQRLHSALIANCKDMKYVFVGVELSELQILSLQFMSKLEDICVRDGGALWKNSFLELRDLTLQQLPNIMNNNIAGSHVNAIKYLFGHEDVLPTIEVMTLYKMDCTEIWHSPPATAGSFSQLRYLDIIEMPHIKYVFPSIAFCTQLTGLEGMYIFRCENLEEVVYEGGDEHVENLKISVFPRLEEIHIRELPKLKHFYGGRRHTLKFPLLNRVYIVECKSMESFSATSSDDPNLALIRPTNQDSHDSARKYLFGPEDVLPAIEVMDLSKMDCAEIWHSPPATAGSFSQLRYLMIIEMPHIKYVFPSIAFCTQLLIRLEQLDIRNCENLEEVVYEEGREHVEDNQLTIISAFPALEYINLFELPKLKHFYGGRRHTLKFPKWRSLDIKECESMKMFTPMLPEAPGLTHINGHPTTPEISMSIIMAIDTANTYADGERIAGSSSTLAGL